MRIRDQAVNWVLALCLSCPVVFFYLAHYSHTLDGDRPTGFVHYDMAYYMANARQYSDGQSNGLMYSNPYDYEDDAPAIYFQPQIMLLGMMRSIAPVDPSIPFLVLGSVCMVLSFYVLSVLITKMFPDADPRLRTLLVVTTAWGGGVFALMGITYSVVTGKSVDILLYDASNGWWFLNFGRNFLFPTESCYHLLTISIYLSVFLGKKRLALALVGLLSLSHPFTGLQYGMIFFAWVLLERFIVKSSVFGNVDVLLSLLPLVYTFGYYVFFLSSFEKHRVLVEHWKNPWSLRVQTILGAYCLVGLSVLFRCRSLTRVRECFHQPFNRFLAICFLVSLGLAKHDILIEPYQPVHFTRGHIWMPLCILGLPAIAELWARFSTKRTILFVGATAWLLFALADNAVFLVNNSKNPTGIYLNRSAREVFEFLEDRKPDAIVLTDEDYLIGYLSAVYSSARPYAGHWGNTPHVERKRESILGLLKEGEIPTELTGREFLVLTRLYRDRMSEDARFVTLVETDEMSLYAYRQPNSENQGASEIDSKR